MRKGKYRIIYLALVLIPLFSISPGIRAEQVGEVVAIEGTSHFLGEQHIPPVLDWALLDWEDEVILLDQLRTQARSKLEVRLAGSHFVLGHSDQVVEVSVAEQQERIVLVLSNGTLRVVTADQPGALIVRTASALGRVVSTSFIVSCGPPVTEHTDTCLFVGVYGRSDVESLAFPGQPVVLDRQFFTIVHKGQLPTQPQSMPDSRFQTLLAETTVLGTGSGQDRIGMADLAAAGAEVLNPNHLIAQVSEQPQPNTAGPGTQNPDTIIDQPPTVYDPDFGGHSPEENPLPEPIPLPLPQLP